MKAYTDIEQSKKLAEILPIESADHHYVRKTCDSTGNPVDGKWSEPKYGNPNSKYANYFVQNFTKYEKLPCWSLAALINIMPKIEGDKAIIYLSDNDNYVSYTHIGINAQANELLDACYEIIIKLHEQKLTSVFPELAESEDERIRKALISGMNALKGQKKETFATIPIDDCITWMEKQGEQKHSKFKVGDWITDGYVGGQITSIEDNYPCYKIADFMGGINTSIPFSLQDNYHLWSIQDAKDGDVLSYVTDEEDLWIMIYWSLYEPYEGHVHYHALLVNDNFSDKGTCCICINDLKPATKEQRDALMKAMTASGYEWDAEKKELKRIKKQALKPKWSYEDEANLNNIIWLCNNCLNGEETTWFPSQAEKIKHLIETIKERGLTYQKPKWTDEDEEKFRDIIGAIHSVEYQTTEDEEARINWLKSLKQRMEEQQ